MKTLQIIRLAFLIILVTGWMQVRGQQQYEVPGDNFSLEGALEIFKKSSSPEEFEKMLNDPEARVNNLDLNGDGYIDYIRVIDMNDGNVHAFVLQAVISERQSQDIAVITLEKQANGRAVLQITGDADIYGVETIIEPTTEVRTYAGYNRSSVIVNVWAWPMVRFIYGPYYRVWVSPWGWAYRPYWWSPWRPYVYYDYYAYWRPYRSYYSVCYTHRVYHAHEIYRPHRTTSVIVYENHQRNIKAYRSSHIDRNGRYVSNNDRYPSRRTTEARYNGEGRIVSDANARVSSRSSSRSSVVQGRSSATRESGNTIQRSEINSRRSEGNNNTGRSIERSNSNTNLRRSGVISSTERPSGRSAGSSDINRSSGNSNVQRSDVRTNTGQNYRRANSSTEVQRSTGNTNRNSNVQRSSTQRSGNNSGYRPSSGGASSGRSYGTSSGNSGSRYSSGNSNARRSSGSSQSIQRSSGSRSNVPSSPSRSSGSSGSRSSGSSGRQSGGRR